MIRASGLWRMVNRFGQRSADPACSQGGTPWAVTLITLVTLAAALPPACGGETPGRVGEHSASLVTGADDRVEYFDVADPTARGRISESMVALVPRAFLARMGAGYVLTAQSWGQAEGLCPGERFADQPAAAFCTGVLVDWDLVLTAGHCVRLFALEDFAIVFGFYYGSAGTLAFNDVREAREVRDPIAIVSEALDPAGAEPRLDYAWLRLDRAVAPPRQPAPLYVRPHPLAAGDPIISIGCGGGVPLKLDAGGVVRDARAAVADYFLADTDTSHGSSGGGAFDQALSLVGVFARGGADTVITAEGCFETIVQPDGTATEEQFSYVHRAVEGLCRDAPLGSSLCRSDCGDPCAALPPPPAGDGGCAVAAGNDRASGPGLSIAPIGIWLLFWRARRAAPAPRRSTLARCRARSPRWRVRPRARWACAAAADRRPACRRCAARSAPRI